MQTRDYACLTKGLGTYIHNMLSECVHSGNVQQRFLLCLMPASSAIYDECTIKPIHRDLSTLRGEMRKCDAAGNCGSYSGRKWHM
jgi:hypothetical protein